MKGLNGGTVSKSGDILHVTVGGNSGTAKVSEIKDDVFDRAGTYSNGVYFTFLANGTVTITIGNKSDTFSETQFHSLLT